MIVEADNRQRAGWALQEARTGYINLAEICEDEETAHALLRVMKIRQSHRGKWKAVPVMITVEAVKHG
ncbi:MAG: hypothetical protein WA777_20050 [Rhodanobacter sp.]